MQLMMVKEEQLIKHKAKRGKNEGKRQWEKFTDVRGEK